ncbi:MAG: serine/threonine protein kinase [Planctomycetes bacterium]|nr:serine/threonine protein kinase [Planctomycetota bacterium]MCB9887784.1 serine/threonine protein kinase [Planctomycetota bacterium]
MNTPSMPATPPETCCPRCQATVPPATGHCPRCLLALAMTTGAAATSARPGPPAPTPEELQPLFADYELQTLLGRGGMGFVYRARHRRLDRIVALKLLRGDLAADPAFAERFEREARALAMLDHPGIVGVHDFGRAGDWFFLAMEYVDGANLRDLLRGGQLTTRDVLTFVPQLCDALQYAHDRRVVHRDIKPENILVDQDGKVHVADFGLAKLLGDGPGIGLTQSDQAVGTPHYMAPEQVVASGSVDHRADLYSLGVVLYEMLTGTLPIGRFAPPSSSAPAARGFDPVVMKSLENDPARRHQTANDVKSHLQEAGGRRAAAPVAPRRRTLREHPHIGRYELWVVASCAAFAGLGPFGFAVAVYMVWFAMSRLDLPPNPQRPRAPGALPWLHVLGGLAASIAAFFVWASVSPSALHANLLRSESGYQTLVVTATGSVAGIPLLISPLLTLFAAVLGTLRGFGFVPPGGLLVAATVAGALPALMTIVVGARSDHADVGPGSLVTAMVCVMFLLQELRVSAATGGTRRHRRSSAAGA